MSLSASIAPLAGRLMLAWYFFSQAIARIHEWDAMVLLVQMRHLPFAPAVLALAILLMILGGITLVLGYETKLGALLLSSCTMAWLVGAHNFWSIQDPIERAADYQIFALGIAVIGGLFVLAGLGGGRFSLDHARGA